MHPNEPSNAGTCTMQQQQEGSSWLCRVCGNINKEKRVRCNMTVCQAPRGFPGPFNEVAIGTPLPDSASMKWRCPVCQEMNRGRRLNCYRSECPGTRQQQQLQQHQQLSNTNTSPPTSAGTQGESDSSQHSSDILPSKPSTAGNGSVTVKQEATPTLKSPPPFANSFSAAAANTPVFGPQPPLSVQSNQQQPLFVSRMTPTPNGAAMQSLPIASPHGPFQLSSGDGAWANTVGMPQQMFNGNGIRIPSVLVGGVPPRMDGRTAVVGEVSLPQYQQAYAFHPQVPAYQQR